MSSQTDNELICKRLLGWARIESLHDARGRASWSQPYGPAIHTVMTPTFTTWAEAGLILDALAAQWPRSKAIFRGLGGAMCLGGITPAEIRTDALEYLRASEQAPGSTP